MAYDPLTAQMVLFGGEYDAGRTAVPLGDSWTSDGSTWTQNSPAATPSPRGGAAMAYDPTIRRIVLFGGWGPSTQTFDDTWTFDGTTWTQQSPAASPPAAAGMPMAYDPAIGQLVLYLGPANGFAGGTWTYDGIAWAEQPPATSPPVWASASMAYDPAIGRMVLFGGLGNGVQSDTWTFDGTTWTQQSPAASPPAREGATMAYDPATGLMVLFGGQNLAGEYGSFFADTWTFDGTIWMQQPVRVGPPARTVGSMDYDTTTGRLMLFGGWSYKDGLDVLGDTWTYDGAGWSLQSTTAVPVDLASASMAFDPATGQTILFGGLNHGPILKDSGETWAYDGSPWRELSPAVSPPARDTASMAYDPATGLLVLFGGSASGVPLGDTWTWNGITWTRQSPAASPPPRLGAAMAFDPATGQMVLYGGCSSTQGAYGDTWTYDGNTWTQQSSATSPGGNCTNAMAYDPAARQLILFGTISHSSLGGSTYVYEAGTWVLQPQGVAPPESLGTAMAYDPAIRQLVLFGGDLNGGSTTFGDTWTYDGSGWAQASPVASPSPRSGATMAYDQVTGRLVLFGGYDGTTSLADTWIFQASPSPVVAFTSTPPSTDDSNVAVFAFTASESGVPSSSLTTSCSLGGAPFTTCTSPVTVTNLRNGYYSFTVVATDPGSQIGAAASDSWLVDAPTPSAGPSPPAPPTPSIGSSPPAPPTTIPGPGATAAGYDMLDAAGAIYSFGGAACADQLVLPAGTVATDLASTPSGQGLWVVDDRGDVVKCGDAGYFGGNPGRRPGEAVVSISGTPDARGYWLFTSMGRVLNYGDAAFFGDMSGTTLNGPVVKAVATPSGQGYYMVASDGGIFTFGDVKFAGSMGGRHLNKLVVGLAPNPSGTGYWEVASDGGIFAFNAPFLGSMGGSAINRPVVGVVAYGAGYLMVASDGGIFDFSNSPFAGSLGRNPPVEPIVAVTPQR